MTDTINVCDTKEAMTAVASIMIFCNHPSKKLLYIMLSARFFADILQDRNFIEQGTNTFPFSFEIRCF